MNIRYFLVFMMAILVAACGVESPSDTEEPGIGRKKPLIVASNYPLYFFAREIAGDSAEVVFPVMRGDPADWKPDSESIALLQSADLVILNGAGYESWLDWVSLPSEVLIDTSAGIREQLLPLEEETLHQHGPQGEHSHTGYAFTVWLNPVLAASQARAIEKAISERIPENRENHRARLAEIEAELSDLDGALQLAFEAVGDQYFVFSHPVYQYLAQRYGIKGVSMHWEPEEEPGVKAWIEFQNALQSHPATQMIWEDQPVQATLDKLRTSGIRPIVFRTASNRPKDKDYFGVMYANIEGLGLD